ncbi:MAG: DsrE family protein [Spirochaetota bacterium]|nr:DsrE family protein [Spirochaetota bacterium]
MSNVNKNLIIITTGKEDRGGRAIVGFCMAASSIALGIDTTVFLTLNGTIWGMNGQAENVKIDGFEPLTVYMDQFLENGGKILVCSPCVEFFCNLKIKSKTKEDSLIKGAEFAGFPTVTSIMAESSVVSL